MKFSTSKIWILGATLGLGLLVGCGKTEEKAVDGGSTATAASGLKGDIKIDGSSTVFPATQAVAEEFNAKNKDVKISVSVSGTGGGFKKFCAKEIDISNASRPIEQGEIDSCKTGGVEFIEIPVAYDGLTVVINKGNTWATKLTVDELKAMWMLNSTVKSWKDVRPGFPDKPIKFYGAGTDSGTFDYFTKAICGKEKEIRGDYSGSEDDNATVQGVAGDEGAIGFFGFSYFEENKDKLTAVAIGATGAEVGPSIETINNGTYAPLSRPEFIYVTKTAAERPEVKAFVEFYLSKEGHEVIKEAGFIPLTDSAYEMIIARFKAATTGSVFGGSIQVGAKLEDLLSAGK